MLFRSSFLSLQYSGSNFARKSLGLQRRMHSCGVDYPCEAKLCGPGTGLIGGVFDYKGQPQGFALFLAASEPIEVAGGFQIECFFAGSSDDYFRWWAEQKCRIPLGTTTVMLDNASHRPDHGSDLVHLHDFKFIDPWKVKLLGSKARPDAWTSLAWRSTCRTITKIIEEAWLPMGVTKVTQRVPQEPGPPTPSGAGEDARGRQALAAALDMEGLPDEMLSREELSHQLASARAELDRACETTTDRRRSREARPRLAPGYSHVPQQASRAHHGKGQCSDGRIGFREASEEQRCIPSSSSRRVGLKRDHSSFRRRSRSVRRTHWAHGATEASSRTTWPPGAFNTHADEGAVHFIHRSGHGVGLSGSDAFRQQRLPHHRLCPQASTGCPEHQDVEGAPDYHPGARFDSQGVASCKLRIFSPSASKLWRHQCYRDLGRRLDGSNWFRRKP